MHKKDTTSMMRHMDQKAQLRDEEAGTTRKKRTRRTQAEVSTPQTKTAKSDSLSEHDETPAKENQPGRGSSHGLDHDDDMHETFMDRLMKQRNNIVTAGVVVISGGKSDSSDDFCP